MNSSTGPSFAPPHETEIIKADNLLERNAGGFLTELDMEKRAERRGSILTIWASTSRPEINTARMVRPTGYKVQASRCSVRRFFPVGSP
jgi:hypothetical protein